MAFNWLLGRFNNPVIRVALILVWPQIGVLLVLAAGLPLTGSVFLWWGLATAAFYAWRLLTVRELGQWTAMLATSAFALTWVMAADSDRAIDLHAFVLGFAVAPALLAAVTALLERRLGAAYTGLVTGMARDIPRLAGLITVVLLAAMALPISPGFFVMLNLLFQSSPAPVIVALLTWLLWSWAGTRVLRNTVFGPRSGKSVADLPVAHTWAFAAVIVATVVLNLIWTGA
jgi:NADH:ubiquinone oxidoreductase subunit 4 (subunit M)